MELKVKKQVEETVEVKTPAYYRDWLGNYCHINEAGTLTVVRQQMIALWVKDESVHYSNEIIDLMAKGKECPANEFFNAYHRTLANIQAAVDNVDITTPVTEMPS